MSRRSLAASAASGRVVRATGCLLLLLCLAGSARAHQASMSYAEFAVSDDRTRVDVRLRIRMSDMAEPLGLPVDTEASNDQLHRGSKRVFDYVLERLGVETNGATCPIHRGTVAVVQDPARFAEIRWAVHCPSAFDSLAVEYDLFFDIDPLHTGNLRVTVGDEVAVVPLGSDRRRFSWPDLGAAPPSSWLAFVGLGIEHIVYGFDHVCFLLGLLLVSVVARPRGRSWEVRGLLGADGKHGALRYTAGIVTSFTVAHSITLVAAALGWISLPSHIVEILIALSILYVAIENLITAEPRFRWMLTFVFGLVHGLGFASVLRVLLPPEDVVLPLLFFNLGVELGQLAIVAIALPLLILLARRVLGAQDYRRLALPLGSAAVGVLATLWLLERVFELRIL